MANDHTHMGMAAAGHEAARRLVAVVEDDLAVLGALRFALETDGFAVASYCSGAELLAQRALPEGSVLVIDFRLPDMTGIELLALLRGRNVKLPAILMAGQPSPALRAQAAEAGMIVVEKPLLGDSLVEAIGRMIGHEAPCAPAMCG